MTVYALPNIDVSMKYEDIVRDEFRVAFDCKYCLYDAFSREDASTWVKTFSGSFFSDVNISMKIIYWLSSQNIELMTNIEISGKITP